MAREYERHWPAAILEAGRVDCEPTEELPGTVFDMGLMEGGKWGDAIASIDSDECVIPKMIKPYIRTAVGMFEYEEEMEFALKMKGVEVCANGAEWVRIVNSRMKTGMYWKIDAVALCKVGHGESATTVRRSAEEIAVDAAAQLRRMAETEAVLQGWRTHMRTVVTLCAFLGCTAAVVGAGGPGTRTGMAWGLLSQVLVLGLSDAWLVASAALDSMGLFRRFQTHLLKAAAAFVVGLQLIVSSFGLVGYEENYWLTLMPVYAVCSIVVHGMCAAFIQRVQWRERRTTS